MSWEGHLLVAVFPQAHNPTLIMRKASDNEVVVEGYFPVVRGLEHHTPSAWGPGSTAGQGTTAHTPQRRSKITRAASKTWHSPINKF